MSRSPLTARNLRNIWQRTAHAESLEVRRLLATWEVDDDLQQCPDADYTSINAAVLAPTTLPGDTILVCPGRYNEAVQVIKPDLTFRAERQAILAQPHVGDPADPTRFAIVDPPDAPVPLFSGFDVQMDRTTIEGFILEQSSTAGVFTSRLTSGHVIRRNLIRDNVQGIYLNSSGAEPTVVEHNVLFRNNRPGPASGNGIYSDMGVSNAFIRHNLFLNNASSGIVFDTFLTTPTDVFIQNNDAEANGSFAVLFNSNNITVEDNRVRRSAGSGIFVFNGGGHLIEDNHLSEGGGTAVNLNNTTNNTVNRNQIDDNRGSGIRLANADNNVISRNHVRRNGNPVGDTTDGIRVFSTSAGNLIVGNHMRQNLAHDAHDDSVGTGTAGTANIWEDNHCETENRPGLCEH